MRDTHDRRRGVGYVLLAAACFSVSTPLAKTLVGVVSSQLLAGLFYFGSGLGAALLAIMTPKTLVSNESSLTRTDAPWILGTVVFGGIIAPLLLLNGLLDLPASNASLLLNFEAVFTILLAWVVFHEELNRRFGLGASAILAGSALISWNGFQAVGDLSGSLAIIGACFFWGVDNNLMRVISHRNPFQVTSVRGLLAGGFNLLLGLWLVGRWSPWWILAGLVVGIFSFGFSNVFWVLALRYLGSARAGTYYSSAPFIGAVVSVVLLREAVTTLLLAAAFSMAIGVWLLSTEKAAHLKTNQDENKGSVL
jgi:drug/metabolite transporter (DMT)-like permease